MTSQEPISAMMDRLNQLRARLGEDYFRYAAAQAARMILADQPEREPELREALKDIPDLDELLKNPPPFPGRASAKEPEADQMMAAIKQSMPNLKSQAQLDVVLSAFDALRMALNATFAGESARSASARETLLQALDTAVKVTDMTNKLRDVPEAATSKEAEAFKNPPAQFGEREVLDALMVELSQISSKDHLNQWYTNNRPRMDQIVSQNYRNELLDSVRARKKDLAEAMMEENRLKEGLEAL